jgi:hypothetical protein
MKISDDSKDTLRRLRAVQLVAAYSSNRKYEDIFHEIMTCSESYLHFVEIAFEPEEEWIEKLNKAYSPEFKNRRLLRIVR